MGGLGRHTSFEIDKFDKTVADDLDKIMFYAAFFELPARSCHKRCFQ